MIFVTNMYEVQPNQLNRVNRLVEVNQTTASPERKWEPINYQQKFQNIGIDVVPENPQ